MSRPEVPGPPAGKYVVCGGSRGIGFATARQLLEFGNNVVLVASNPRNLSRAKQTLEREFPASTIESHAIDLSLAASESRLRRALAKAGPIQGLVVTVGNGRPGSGPAQSVFEAAIAKNVTPAVNSFRATLGSLRRSVGASVVFVSSIASRERISAPSEYAAAKASLEVLALYWAKEVPPVRVNVVSPGNVLTLDSVWHRAAEEDASGLADFLESEVPLGRLASPDEISSTICFLLSEAASFVNGSVLVADGGQKRSL